MSYIIYAFLGALCASIGTIFAKYGLKGVDSNLLTAIRGITMAIIVTIAAFSFGKLNIVSLSSLSGKQWLFVILSGVGGALSWIFFYQALSSGPVVSVTVIDKLSIIITALLAFFILSEKITFQSGIGLFLIGLGSVLVAVPVEKILSLFTK